MHSCLSISLKKHGFHLNSNANLLKWWEIHDYLRHEAGIFFTSNLFFSFQVIFVLFFFFSFIFSCFFAFFYSSCFHLFSLCLSFLSFPHFLFLPILSFFLSFIRCSTMFSHPSFTTCFEDRICHRYTFFASHGS